MPNIATVKMHRWSDNPDPPALPPMIEVLPHSVRNVPTTVTLANSELRIDRKA
jgi:hypothetical protein